MPPPSENKKPDAKPSEKINIIVIGAAYAGTHVTHELLDRLNSYIGLDMSQSPESNYHITVIEPKTAFEAVTGIWNLLAQPDEFWKLDMITSNPAPSQLDVEKIYQSALDTVTRTRFHDSSLQYQDSTLVSPNVSIFSGVCHRIFANHIEVKIPLYLFSLLPETYQLMVQNDRNYSLLFENRKEVPVVVPRCNITSFDDSDDDSSEGDYALPKTTSNLQALTLQTRPPTGSNRTNRRASIVASPPPVTLEHNIPSIVDNNDGTYSISITFPFHILLNCSGSSSFQPIKTAEQIDNSTIFTMCRDNYEHRSDLIADLIDFFYNRNLTLLTKLPETLHLTLQSLLYLHKDTTKALLLHYFPQYGVDILADTLAPEHFHTLRVLSLLAYVLRLPVRSLLNYMVVPLKLCAGLKEKDGEELLAQDPPNSPSSDSEILKSSTSASSTQPMPSLDRTTTPLRTGGPLNLDQVPPPPPPKSTTPVLAQAPTTPAINKTSSATNPSPAISDPEHPSNNNSQQRTSNADQQRPSIQLMPSLNQHRLSIQNSTSGLASTTREFTPTPHFSGQFSSRSSLPTGYHLQPLPISQLLSFQLLTDLYHQTFPIPKHNSVFARYVELSAIRAMLLYNHYTRTDKALYYEDVQLPIIHRVNMIGGGPTAIELLGALMDIYYNHYTEHKKIIKQFQHDLKKKKESTVFGSDTDFTRFNITNFSKPEFHAFCSSTLGSSLATSVQKRVRKHYQKAYEKCITSFTLHEDTMFGVHTTLEQEQENLLLQFVQLRDVEENAPKKEPTVGGLSKWDPIFYNKWSQITIFATGINRSSLIQQYKPTPQMMMKETVDKVLAFIARTNNPNAPPSQDSGSAKFTSPASPTPGHRSGQSRDPRSTGEFTPSADRKSRPPVSRQPTRQPTSMVEQLQNMTKHHEQFSNLLSRIPGMIFILGDAALNPGHLPMAYSAVTSAPIVAVNVVLYINRVLRPLLESISASYSNQLVIPGSGGQLNPYPKIITPLHLDEAISSMGNASATPDMMVVSLGHLDAVITSSSSQVTRFLPFGNTIALEYKKNAHLEPIERVRRHKSKK